MFRSGQQFRGGEGIVTKGVEDPGGRRHRGQQGKEHDCGQQGRAQPEGCNYLGAASLTDAGTTSLSGYAASVSHRDAAGEPFAGSLFFHR